MLFRIENTFKNKFTFLAYFMAEIHSNIHERRSQVLQPPLLLSLFYSWSPDNKGWSIYICEHVYTYIQKKRNNKTHQVLTAQILFLI